MNKDGASSGGQRQKVLEGRPLDDADAPTLAESRSERWNAFVQLDGREPVGRTAEAT